MHRSTLLAFAAALALQLATLAGAPLQAASIYLTPASSSVPLSAGTTTLELFADFTGEPTIGGGIDLTFSGPTSLNGFTPSAWFTTVPDPAFTGYGQGNADGDFEVHFGSFAGVSGLNKLGDLTLNLSDTGLIQVTMGINSFYGPFFGIVGTEPLDVTLSGAEVSVVPLPASVWLLGTAIAGLAGRRLRKTLAT